jgi:glutamate:Na+ symporter, ESS family
MKLVEVPGFLTFTIAIVVFFAGAGVNRLIAPLRQWNIPEAVTGGLLAALAMLAARLLFHLDIRFELEARDLLLLYFFTGIGLNAKLADLLSGGRPLAILLAITVGFLVIQNLIAIGSVAAFGLPKGLTIFLGSASLIGGHGTTIAWAPLVSSRFGLQNALEVGIAAATLGLVLASLAGGPIARYLIARNKLKSASTDELIMGVAETVPPEAVDMSHISLLRTLLVLNIAILIAYALEETVEETGLKVPLFVVCLLVGITLTNLVPRFMPRLQWPARTRALALISDVSLNIFLAMSLMSMQLWALGGLGPSLLLVLALQTLAAAIYIVFVVFPAMGGDYEAAVLAAGFTGISLGATPTAIANMTAVTKVHGPATRAFIILPLVSAFFIDIANAVAISLMTR